MKKVFFCLAKVWLGIFCPNPSHPLLSSPSLLPSSTYEMCCLLFSSSPPPYSSSFCFPQLRSRPLWARRRNHKRRRRRIERSPPPSIPRKESLKVGGAFVCILKRCFCVRKRELWVVGFYIDRAVFGGIIPRLNASLFAKGNLLEAIYSC